ncbi:MAG: T9SS type A sorting domain-containing protein [Bacteroidia bacterium]
MKTSLLCFAALTIGTSLSAQITITEIDIAPHFTQVLQRNDTTPTVTPGMAGTNITYDLSALQDQSTDTILFTQPSFTPNGANFPGSNTAAVYNTTQAYIYFNESATAFQITGQAADPVGSGIVDIPFSDYEKVLSYPTTYNTSFTDYARGEGYTFLGYDPGIGFQIDSVHIKSSVYKNSIADGWGTAITPLDTFNVVRVNTTRLQVDTIDVQTMGVWIYDALIQMDSVRTYTYYTNGIGYPLAELTDSQDLGTITRATWLSTLPQYNVGMNELAIQPDMNVYPNPSVETVTFVSNGANVSLITILDMNGRIVKTANVTADRTSVNVSDLSSGMYFFQALNANGTILEKGKLNVYH